MNDFERDLKAVPGLTGWAVGEDIDLRDLDNVDQVTVYDTRYRSPYELLLIGLLSALLVIVVVAGPPLIVLAWQAVLGS